MATTRPAVARIPPVMDAALPAPQTPAAAVPSPAAAMPSEPTSLQHVFRLQLDRGHCTLEKMEEVRGAFGRERVQPWQSGMLCCRLVAEDGRIIAERTMQAPDYVCVVLDPNAESKTPVAARLTSGGPVTFQVRFPEIAGAVRLDVNRISTETRPANLTEPIGPLVASIAIPTR